MWTWSGSLQVSHPCNLQLCLSSVAANKRNKTLAWPPQDIAACRANHVCERWLRALRAKRTRTFLLSSRPHPNSSCARHPLTRGSDTCFALSFPCPQRKTGGAYFGECASYRLDRPAAGLHRSSPMWLMVLTNNAGLTCNYKSNATR